MFTPKKRETPKPKRTALVTFIIPNANLSTSNDTRTNSRIINPLKVMSKNGGRVIFILQR